MKKAGQRIDQVLDRLHQHFGEQKAVGPTDPYEMILFVSCGYPATDESCTSGFETLKRGVGTKPEKIRGAPKAKLTRLMRLGGIVPENPMRPARSA